MNLFNVYPLYDVTPVKAVGSTIIDDKGVEYLDLYGGHAVISVGHSHPKYVERLKNQLDNIAFYSNAIQNPLQEELATKLGELSNCEHYGLFLCSSGAEANENALKMASFITGKSRIITFHNSFHGRTSAAVAVTDNEKINAPLNKQHEVTFLPFDDEMALEKELKKGDVAGVIIESIQGVGGLEQASTSFFKALERLCKQYEVVLILDEVQAGYGRTGKFFGFQHHDIQPDIITIAKGMGNGFPIGGVLISHQYEAKYGMLGTTFGGNHLSCAAGIAVLDIIKEENLMQNATNISNYFIEAIKAVPQVKKIKGRGLMIGIEFDFDIADLRKKLVVDKHIFTGNSSNKNLIRILPSLTITKDKIDFFIVALKESLKELNL
jgi:acetylornithine/N-succinyldiaminopimelate aminotransferase